MVKVSLTAPWLTLNLVPPYLLKGWQRFSRLRALSTIISISWCNLGIYGRAWWGNLQPWWLNIWTSDLWPLLWFSENAFGSDDIETLVREAQVKHSGQILRTFTFVSIFKTACCCTVHTWVLRGCRGSLRSPRTIH